MLALEADRAGVPDVHAADELAARVAMVTRPLESRTATRPSSVASASGRAVGVTIGTPLHVLGTKLTLDGSRALIGERRARR